MLWCAKETEEFQSLDATALPLGIMPDFMGDEIGPLMLEIGGMLIVTSDGIFEAPNHTDEQFGIERLSRELARLGNVPAAQIRDGLCAAVTEFMAEQHDDIALLVARYRAPA